MRGQPELGVTSIGRQPLRPHPRTPCARLDELEAEVIRLPSNALILGYFLTGAMAELSLPPLAPARRADELWRHTCFEAFVGVVGEEPYFEFNFATSGQWAAYRFSGYRAGMSIAGEIDAPRLEVRMTARTCALKMFLELGRLADLRADARWRLGLSAVIEDKAGGKSYWALAHPPGKADFHHAVSFARELPPMEP